MRRRRSASLALPLLALAAGCALVPALARAQRADETPLENVIELMLLDRQLIAIDALGGGQKAERLHLKEQVVWMGSRGAVGVVLTNERILAVAQRSGAWQEERYLRTESVSHDVWFGDRVALVLTTNRVIGFNGVTGNLITEPLGVREQVLGRGVGANVVVVVTDRRALGLSPLVGGFFPVPIDVGERIERVEAKSNLATITTNRRLLIFRTPTGSWEERLLGLGH